MGSRRVINEFEGEDKLCSCDIICGASEDDAGTDTLAAGECPSSTLVLNCD